MAVNTADGALANETTVACKEAEVEANFKADLILPLVNTP